MIAHTKSGRAQKRNISINLTKEERTHRYHNITNVVRDSLCTNCGICYSVCPSHAIVIDKTIDGVFVPEIDNMKCNNCGLCGDVCPGHSIDFDNLNTAFFGKHPDSALLGNFLNCYVGHATEERMRIESSSGGLVTALLIFALENKLIDGALVVRMQKTTPLMPEVVIARTREDILSSQGSKYCPVPVDIGLRQIMRDGGKYAVVGLPCHIEGIRKAEMKDPEMRTKIVLHLGIFCSHSVSFSGTETLLNEEGIDTNQVESLRYRGSGWPGGMTVNLNNGQSKFIPLSLYWGKYLNRSLYIPNRCFFCSDGLAELSDISFGDAWILRECRSDTLGSSVAISRTEVGERFLHEALTAGRIQIHKIDSMQIVTSQRRVLHFKKKNLKARFLAAKLIGKRTPHYNDQNMRRLKPSILAYLLAFIPFLEKYALSNKILAPLFKRIPPVIVKVYRHLLSYVLRVEFSIGVRKIRKIHSVFQVKMEEGNGKNTRD